MNATPDSGDLDFTKALDSPAIPAPSWEAMSEAERQEGTAGATELLRAGYYITVARKAAKVAPLREDGRYSILCIDDDKGLLKILARKLSLDGYAIRTAFDRQTIVAELQKVPPPHLILLEVGLGDTSGFDLLQKLRQHPRLGSVPVVMLTGDVTPASVLHGMANGADGYVSKPFQFEALGTALETVLGIQ
jgi:two-component system, OmpR family, response regulator